MNKRYFSIIAVLLTMPMLVGCNRDAAQNMSDYNLLVLTFGVWQVDVHDDFGVDFLENEVRGIVVGYGGSVATAEDAHYVLTEIAFAESEWFTINSLEFIGENSSFFAFRMDATYHHTPITHELSRIMVERDDVPIADSTQVFRDRETALRRLEEVINENVARSDRREVLHRLTTVADEMNSIWMIWDGWAGASR